MRRKRDSDRRWTPAANAHPPPGKDVLRALEIRLKPDFRRAVAAGFIALLCLTVGNALGGVSRHDHLRPAAIALASGYALFTLIAARSAGREIARIAAPRGGPTAGATLRLLTWVLGYTILVLGVLSLTNINLGGLLVGGAITGIIIGVAAQQTLGNFFAGLVLLFARPYAPGEHLIVHSGALGGPLEGTIIDAGLIFTTLLTPEGQLHLPNAGLLAAAIGAAPRGPNESLITPPARSI